MHLVLTRSYYRDGTNGVLQCEGKTLCHTIERSWQNNLPCFSCIPEGLYRLQKRYSFKHKDHLRVRDVPGRKLILLHPANNARKELLGCIAPVTRTTGDGEGIGSKEATDLLYHHVMRRMSTEKVWLLIRSDTGPILYPAAVPLLPQLRLAA